MTLIILAILVLLVCLDVVILHKLNTGSAVVVNNKHFYYPADERETRKSNKQQKGASVNVKE